MSVLHASHSMLKMTMSFYENRGTGPLGPWNMDPIYVVSAFGSMHSGILYERHKIPKVTNRSAFVPEISSGQRIIWPLWFLHVAWRQYKEWFRISVCGLRPTDSWDMTLDRYIHTSSVKCQFCMLAIPFWKWPCSIMKVLVRDHVDHEIWNLYMWSVPLDRCSPAFSVRGENFQKVTNWSALVPQISSEQRDVWPFHLLHAAQMQWNVWSEISLWVI